MSGCRYFFQGRVCERCYYHPGYQSPLPMGGGTRIPVDLCSLHWIGHFALPRTVAFEAALRAHCDLHAVPRAVTECPSTCARYVSTIPRLLSSGVTQCEVCCNSTTSAAGQHDEHAGRRPPWCPTSRRTLSGVQPRPVPQHGNIPDGSLMTSFDPHSLHTSPDCRTPRDPSTQSYLTPSLSR